MNTKILNELRKLDFESDIEKSISDTFFEGEDKRPYPLPRLGKSLDLKPLANHINNIILDNYFRNHWKADWSAFSHSNEGVADKINATNPDRVIDIGCGDNKLKDKVQNLVGVDPYNSAADYEVDILEYDELYNSFDHAIVFGSINFGNKEDIEPRLEKAIGLVKPGGTLYFRVNPGLQHTKPEAKWIQFFDWSEKNISEYANKYNCKVENLQWERDNGRGQPRIYFELIKC